MTDANIDRIVRLENTNYDRRRKLKIEDVRRIRALHTQGYSIPKLAKMYNVTYPTIKYHLDSNFKAEAIKNRKFYAFSEVDFNAYRADRIAYKKKILDGLV